jgi:ribosome maturation factor RimP
MAEGLHTSLVALIEPLLGQLGFELADLEFFAGSRNAQLRVYIEREGGVTIEDCERVSREISALLDVRDPITSSYRLEVSSPGFDRVLRKAQHFERFVGSTICAELRQPRDGRRRFQGQLTQAGPAGIEVNVDGQVVPLSLQDISVARLVPQWPDTDRKGRKG